MKKDSTLLRKQLQKHIHTLHDAFRYERPREGWIKSLRMALGMNADQLARRMGCTQSNVTYLEQREQKKSITLSRLEEAAHAMGCRFVYALIPECPLEEMRRRQAMTKVLPLVQSVSQTMELEQQGLSEADQREHLQDMIDHYLSKHSHDLWEA